MRLIAKLVLVAAALPLLTAAVILPEWQQQLYDQLKKEQNCEVNFLSNIQMRVVNGSETVLARAHCMDKRDFDASRMGAGKPYKLQECSTNAC